MSDPNAMGVIYAIERLDLHKVYVGQTADLAGRVRTHRKRNTCELFTGGDPVIVTVSTYPVGRELNAAESRTARVYEAAGWDVVSNNTVAIGWTSTMGTAGGLVTGRKNVESGHLARVSSLGGKTGAGGRVTGRRNLPPGDHARSIQANHVRWHVNRGLVNVDCEHCKSGLPSTS